MCGGRMQQSGVAEHCTKFNGASHAASTIASSRDSPTQLSSVGRPCSHSTSATIATAPAPNWAALDHVHDSRMTESRDHQTMMQSSASTPEMGVWHDTEGCFEKVLRTGFRDLAAVCSEFTPYMDMGLFLTTAIGHSATPSHDMDMLTVTIHDKPPPPAAPPPPPAPSPPPPTSTRRQQPSYTHQINQESSAASNSLAAQIASMVSAHNSAANPSAIQMGSWTPPRDADSWVSWSSGENSMMDGATARETQEPPPAGCDADAIKLFVGNIPKTMSEHQLRQLLELVGKIVHLEIKKARLTHIAFVWYATRHSAEHAILHFKAMHHILPDLSEGQERPLVVRRAKVRPEKNRSWADKTGRSVNNSHNLESRTSSGGNSRMVEDLDRDRGSCPSKHQSNASAPGFMTGRSPALDLLAMLPPSGPPRLGGRQISADLTPPPALPLLQDLSLQDRRSGPNGNGATPHTEDFVLSAPISLQQLSTLSTHLQRMVATASGAKLQLQESSGQNGQTWQLVIRGHPSQVETARDMIDSMAGVKNFN